MSDLDLDAIRADVAGARALWDDRDADPEVIRREQERLGEREEWRCD